MKFSSGVSDAAALQDAAADAAAQAAASLGSDPCHAAFLFAAPSHRARWAEALARVHDTLRPSVVIGCGSSGVVGGEHEFESGPALSLLGAHLPGVKLHPFAVHPEEMELASPGGFWVDKVGVLPSQHPAFVLLVDPFTCDPTRLLSELSGTYPGSPVIGGLVSGGRRDGDHLLCYQRELLQAGAVGIALTGDVALETLVSTSCRPIGHPLIVTKAEENVVWELGGQPAVEMLRRTLMGLAPSDQELAQRSIMVGVVINEMKSAFSAGDFLVRPLVGIDPPSGALALSDAAVVGQTVQFHLQDPQASRQELRRLLAQQSAQAQETPPAGALLFACTGRGKAFYGLPHQDTKAIRAFSGKLPVGGCFCNGEIGPVGRANFIHGYTASVGFFRPLTSVRARSDARPAAQPVGQ